MRPFRLRVLVLLSVAGAITACGERRESGPPHPRTAIEASKTFPENYEVIINEAWSADSLAVGALFGFEDQGAFTGKAAQEHREVLWAVLQHIGDGRFASIARPENSRIRGVVLRALEQASGGKIDARFPKTAAALASLGAP